jgi:hypothetical protein
VLICDETGFSKEGPRLGGRAAPIQRTAGRVENSQVGVFVSYARAPGCSGLEGLSPGM